MKSAAAALSAVARHHGLPVDAARLLALEPFEPGLVGLIHAAHRLGFAVLPLEGDLEHLPEVPRPCLVFLGQGGEPEPHVLLDLGEEVSLGEPAPRRLSAADFAREWTGDVLQLTPRPAALEATRARLAEPRAPRRILPVAATLLATAAVIAAARAPSLALALSSVLVGVAALASLRAALDSAACASCSRARALVGGLPVAWAGVAFYSLLLVLRAPAMLFFATGVHAALVRLLDQERIPCAPCLIAALAAALAAAASAAGGSSPLALLALPAGFAVAELGARRARAALLARGRAAALQLAERTAGEPPPAPGCAVLIIYRRSSCALCSFVEAVVRPALEDEFGEVLRVEERDLGDEPSLSPLLVVRGAGSSTPFLGFDPEGGHDAVRAAIESALRPGAT